MSSIKLKSSALIIAFFVGAILSTLLVAVLLEITQNTRNLSRNANYEIAKITAQNGIKSGMKKYKNHEESSLYRPQRTDEKQNNRRTFYNVSIETAPLSFGANLDASNWFSNSNLAREQGAYELRGSEKFVLDLSAWFKKDIKERPQSITVLYSDPFKRSGESVAQNSAEGKVAKASYRLFKDDQKIKSAEAKSDNSHQFKVESLQDCNEKDVKCRLEIEFILPDQVNAFFKIKAENSRGIIASTSDRPGTKYIRSTGYYMGAKAKLVYKIDSSGKDLGLFEQGVYCKDRCEMKY